MTKYIFLFFALTLVGCKTYEVNELPDKQLIWGSGGGFTGAVNQYILLENGQLFFNDGLKNTKHEMTKQQKQVAKTLFSKCVDLDVEGMEMNEPGNLYYFICSKSDEKENTITWGAMDYKLDSTIQNFYQELQNLANDSKMIEDKTSAEL